MIKLGFNLSAKGSYKVSVVHPDGRVDAVIEKQDNLILDAGMDAVATRAWFSVIAFGAIGTGTTPTRVVLDGTISLSGTTVTLSGSSYSFVSGDVGTWIKFGSGEERKITAFTNSTTVTVGTAGTIGSTTGILYRCGQTGLTTETVRVGNLISNDTGIYPAFTETDGRWSQGFFPNATTGSMMMRRTIDFPIEGSNITYYEAGVGWSGTGPGNLFSRIVFGTPVFVPSGSKARIQYNLTLTGIPGTSVRPTNRTLTITGWPNTYNISSITSTVSNFTVTTSSNHHYLAGGKINISGAAVSAYNGEWTIASVTSNTITVTSAINPGAAGAAGTVFNNLKAGVYMARWGFGVGNGSGTVYNNFSTIDNGMGWPTTNGNPGTASSALNGSEGAIFGTSPSASAGYPLWDGAHGTNAANFNNVESAIRVGIKEVPQTTFTAGLALGGATSITATLGAVNAPNTVTLAAYTAGNFYRDCTSVFASGSVNFSTIRTLVLISGPVANSFSNPNNSVMIIHLEEPQRKESGKSLTFVVRRSWSRVLS